jgi:hypothetical protein
MNNLEVHSKINQTYNNKSTNRANANLVTINEKVNLTKSQYEVLKTICDTYEQSISEYMREALIEAMKFDITDGNFPDILLGKLDEDHEKINFSLPSEITKGKLDNLQLS